MFVLRDKIKRVLRTKADKKSERQKLIDGFNPEKYKKYNWKEKYNPWWITVLIKEGKNIKKTIFAFSHISWECRKKN